MITDFMMKHYSGPTWEWIAGMCFYREQRKALEEAKEYFKRKLGILLIIHRAHEFPCSLICAEVMVYPFLLSKVITKSWPTNALFVHAEQNNVIMAELNVVINN